MLWLLVSSAPLARLVEESPRVALEVLELRLGNPFSDPWVKLAIFKAQLNLGLLDTALLGSLPRKPKLLALKYSLDYLIEEGRHAEALELARKNQALVNSRAYLLWREAMALEGLGRSPKRPLLRIVRDFPSSSQALWALGKLKKLPKSLKAKVLFAHKKYSQVLKLWKKPPRGPEDRYRFALSLYRLKKYEEFVKVKLPRRLRSSLKADWLFYRSVALFRLGRVDEALRDLRRLWALDPVRAVHEASFQILEAGAYPWADTFYALPSSDSEVLARKGLLALALADTPRAESFLRAALEGGASGIIRAQAAYWLWRITGEEAFRAELYRDPLSYYARLAGVPVMTNSESPNSWAGITPSRDDTLAAEAYAILWDLGWPQFASWVSGRPGAWWLSAARALERGDFWRACLWLTLLYKRGPKERGVPEALLKALYPAFYEETFRRASAEFGVPLALLLGVAREESRFDPEAVSWAGAVGVMQLMPKTARRVADSLGMKGYDLTDIEDNVRLGAAHLREHLDRFGKVHLAVAAYNAGHKAVERWLGFLGSYPDDLFVEFITYGQTRGYTRRVVASYRVYEYLGF